MDETTCATCATPLDPSGACVTCRAAGSGLALLSRSGYASVREMMGLLEAQGLAPEIEQTPPARREDKGPVAWNLYIPAAEAARATEILRQDWAELVGDAEAARAAERGLAGIDLDAGGEIECPACSHRFTPSSREAECPDCGLALGVPGEAGNSGE